MPARPVNFEWRLGILGLFSQQSVADLGIGFFTEVIAVIHFNKLRVCNRAAHLSGARYDESPANSGGLRNGTSAP